MQRSIRNKLSITGEFRLSQEQHDYLQKRFESASIAMIAAGASTLVRAVSLDRFMQHLYEELRAGSKKGELDAP